MEDKMNAPDANDLFHEQLITVLRLQIEKEIIPMHVVVFMPSLHEFFSEIMQLERTSRTEAARLLIDKVLGRRGRAGWFTEFVDALKGAGFEKSFKRLSFQDVRDDQYFQGLVRTCLPVLTKVDPLPLLPHLFQKKVISHEDMEEVTRICSAESSFRAMLDLIFRLNFRKETWFQEFVCALKSNNESTALHALEPLLLSAGSDESLSRVVNWLERGNGEDFESDPTKLKKLAAEEEEELTGSAAATATTARAGIGGEEMSEEIHYQESREPSLDVNAQNLQNNLLEYRSQDKVCNIDDKDINIRLDEKGATAKPTAPAACFIRGSHKSEVMPLTPQLESYGTCAAPRETPLKQLNSGSSSVEETLSKLTLACGGRSRCETRLKLLDFGEEGASSVRGQRSLVYPPPAEELLDLRSCDGDALTKCLNYLQSDSDHSSCNDNNCSKCQVARTKKKKVPTATLR